MTSRWAPSESPASAAGSPATSTTGVPAGPGDPQPISHHGRCASRGTAWDANEPGLSPASVTSSDFGQLFSTPVDGQVYAEPILAAGTLIAATEANGIYGLDPVTGDPTTDIVAITGGSKRTYQHGTLTLKNGKVT
jgi:hypothetical protein